MSDAVQVLNDETFEKVLTDSQIPVLVDFWAPWCGPCKAVAPVLEELSGIMKDKLAFAKINVDEYQDVAVRFQVRSIPCLIVFRGLEVIGRLVGSRGKNELKAALEELL